MKRCYNRANVTETSGDPKPAWATWFDRFIGLFGRIPHRVQVAGLFALFAALATVAAWGDGATTDEGIHLASGYAFLDRGDHLATSHPPLARLWAALPLWVRGLDGVSADSPIWSLPHWTLCTSFISGMPGEKPRLAPRARLFPARLAIVVLGLFIGAVIYAWSRELWGARGGVVSLFLYSLSPGFLAHAHLVTTDAGAALGFVLTCWFHWRHLRRLSWIGAALTGAALGAALLMKISCVVLVPILVLLTIRRVVRVGRLAPLSLSSGASARHVQAYGRSLLRHAGGLCVIGLVSWACLWAGYGFRSTMEGGRWPPADLSTLQGGALKSVVQFIDRHRLLPQAYTQGLSSVVGRERHYMYINGKTEFGPGLEYWYFFPEVVLLKSTPAELVLVAGVVWWTWRRRRSRSTLWACLCLPMIAFFLLAVFSCVYMGQRHLLPIYAILFVASGALVRVCARSEARRRWLAVLLLAQAVSSFSVCPRYLAYFNMIGGGPYRASHYLLDSNLDWGQDLSRLKPVLDTHGIASVYLYYCGTDDPEAYGITYRKSAWWPDARPDLPEEKPGPGDYVAITLHIYRQPGERVRKTLHGLKPIAIAGDCFYIYRLPP